MYTMDLTFTDTWCMIGSVRRETCFNEEEDTPRQLS